MSGIVLVSLSGSCSVMFVVLLAVVIWISGIGLMYGLESRKVLFGCFPSRGIITSVDSFICLFIKKFILIILG